tara:strand:- start:122 stop:673 length:552 start_codon:yes stop_codon:yes gene_type:complete
MRKIKVDACIGHSKISNHSEIKDKMLSLIESSEDSSLQLDGSFISKYDYSISENYEREWVKFLYPHFLPTLSDLMLSLGYADLELWQIWYQQYLKGSSHPWHIHSGHFTGVYYLEHPEGSPSTEILSPYNLETIKVDMVSEGDFIVFPASWIHRGPINEGFRKTIISFNLTITDPRSSLLLSK